MYKHKTSKHPDFLKTVNNIKKSDDKHKQIERKMFTDRPKLG